MREKVQNLMVLLFSFWRIRETANDYAHACQNCGSRKVDIVHVRRQVPIGNPVFSSPAQQKCREFADIVCQECNVRPHLSTRLVWKPA